MSAGLAGRVRDVRLRDYRERQKLSRDALAAKAGIAPSTIYKLERGLGQRPQPRVARLLAEALGVEPDAIDELRETYIPSGLPPAE
jgi:transcriptional regulator with XRE-family HTH domain